MFSVSYFSGCRIESGMTKTVEFYQPNIEPLSYRQGLFSCKSDNQIIKLSIFKGLLTHSAFYKLDVYDVFSQVNTDTIH